MYSANLHIIRPASAGDDAALRRLARLDSQRPLTGPVLVGEIDGSIAAALALADGRVLADPFVPTAYLVASMRSRAAGRRAVAATPSLRDRIRAGVRRIDPTPAPIAA